MRSRRREEKGKEGKEEKNIVDEKGLSLSLSYLFCFCRNCSANFNFLKIIFFIFGVYFAFYSALFHFTGTQEGALHLHIRGYINKWLRF